MANFTFKCEKCNYILNIILNPSDYNNKKDIYCSSCKESTMKRVFSSPSSSIRRTKDEILANAKEEAKKIAQKVRDGDQSLIRDIYGEN